MVGLNNVPSVVMSFVLIGLFLGAGALALSKFSDSLAAGAAKNAVGNATLGIGAIAEQLPTIGVIVAVSVIIAVVLGAFAFGGKNR